MEETQHLTTSLTEQVRAAIALLDSLGVANLCLPHNHQLSSSIKVDDIPLCSQSASVLLEYHAFDSAEERDWFYIRNILGVVLSTAFVALIAGLFLGLLTLDALDLQIIERASNDEQEKVYATGLLPIVRQKHRLLVTLLILNALAYESMPIFIDNLVPSWMAILLSVTLILLFGEILPSAVFTGPDQLRLGYHSVPLVRVFLWLLAPIAVPLANILDRLVESENGGPGQEYNRGELAALVRILYEERMATRTRRRGVLNRNDRKVAQWSHLKKEIMEAAVERLEEAAGVEEESAMEQLTPPLHKTEVDLVEGSLQMKTKVAMDIYTPLRHVYALPENMVLDKINISTIYSAGYSRIPVYRANPSDEHDQSMMLGYLMTRQLMLVDWDHQREVSTLPLQRPLIVSPRADLVDLLRRLRSSGSIMAFVCARPDLATKAVNEHRPIPTEAGFMGLVTLEDIMESILQDRIYDEFDIKERDRAVAKLQKWAAEKLQKFVRKRRRNSLRKTSKAAPVGETTPLLEDKPQYSNFDGYDRYDRIV